MFIRIRIVGLLAVGFVCCLFSIARNSKRPSASVTRSSKTNSIGCWIEDLFHSDALCASARTTFFPTVRLQLNLGVRHMSSINDSSYAHTGTEKNQKFPFA